MDFVSVSKAHFEEAVAMAAPRGERDGSFRSHLVGCLGEVAFREAYNAWRAPSAEYPRIDVDATYRADASDKGIDFEFGKTPVRQADGTIASMPGWTVDVKAHADGISVAPRRRLRSDFFVRASIDPDVATRAWTAPSAARAWSERSLRRKGRLGVALVGWIDAKALARMAGRPDADALSDEDLSHVGKWLYRHLSMERRDPSGARNHAGGIWGASRKVYGADGGPFGDQEEIWSVIDGKRTPIDNPPFDARTRTARSGPPKRPPEGDSPAP